MTLTELAIKYGSDKYYSHSYIPLYSSLFAGRAVQRVCEIGIGFKDLMSPFTPKFVAGSSLYMWHEFWPDAAIFACDIREDALINDNSKQIWSTVCDQSRPSSLKNLIQWSGGGFDVVIDDGSHVFEHQILTAAMLLPHVRKNGIYVIEDTYADKGKWLADEFGGELYAGTKRPDDFMVVIINV